MTEKCCECGGTNTREYVELIHEPVAGRRIAYGSRYCYCLNPKCKVTWYSREQMSEQMVNRQRAIAHPSTEVTS